MSTVLLKDLGRGQQLVQRQQAPLRAAEHADAPDDPVEALRHHRRQSSRLADRYFRFVDDLSCFFEIGGASSPRAALEMMREAEALRRSALESVSQLSVVISHLQQQAPAGAKQSGCVARLTLVKDSG